MLASNRFNRFALTLGMGYNYPYHNPWITDVYFYFPYPFLLDLDGYDVRVKELSAEEREANLETLKFIGREAARRGLDFQLALWTQRYDFDDVPRANYTVEGVTDANLAPYCRDAITRLLEEVPEITGLTFRVHVEGGIAEGDYGFWEQAFAGVAAAGRPVEIDMHGKGLDHRMIDIARRTGMPVTASPKYLAEHMGLPYHQSAIRNKEYPPEAARSDREQLSEGSRKFLRYSYGDLLTKDKDYSVLYRIWAGTQRVLLWGDPVMAAGYGRSSMFAGSDGVEWCEPQSFKGRMGTGIPGQRFSYQKHGLATKQDWRKYAYQYRVWGRLLYNPDAPRDSWMRWLETECGDAAEPCEAGLSLASRVLPLVTLAHGPSASNNHYWPEIDTNLGLVDGSGRRAYAFDMEGPVRFGNAPTFDSALFATAREYAEHLLAGETCHRYTPLDVADWLDDMADGCEMALTRARARRRLRPPRGAAHHRRRPDPRRHRPPLRRALPRRLLGRALRRDQGLGADGARARPRPPRGPRLGGDRRGVARPLPRRHHLRAAELAARLLALPAARDAGRAPRPRVAARLRRHRVGPARRPRRRRDRGAARPPPDRRRRAARPSPTAASPRGSPYAVRIRSVADADPILHYRHVNQAERWRSTAMHRNGDGFAAEIPADYTQSDFHLQYFVSLTRQGQAVLVPGLEGNLANEPYVTVLQD